MTISGYSANLPADTIFDAGIIMLGSTKLGVTRGAPKFTPNRTYENITFDGKYANLKGLDRPMHGEPSLAFTMLEFGGASTGNQIPKLEPGATLATVAAPATPGTLTATGAITGGTLAAGTYYYKWTAVNAGGESLASAEATATVASGTAGSVALSGTAVSGATAYRWYRGTAAGAENTYFQTASNSFTDTGAAGALGTPPAGGSGSTITYTPAPSGTLLAAGAYAQDVRAIWERGGGGYAAIYMPWALCGKYDLAGNNKAEGLINVEFLGRIDPATQLMSAPAYMIELRTALP